MGDGAFAADARGRLNLCRQCTTPEAVGALVRVLRAPECPARDVDVSQNQMRDEDAAAVAAALGPRVESLSFFHSGLGAEGARAVLGAVPPSLTHLNLGANPIGDEGAKALAGALAQRDCALASVVVGDRSIGLPGVRALALSLAENQSLTAAKLQWAMDENADACAEAVAAALAENCALTELDLTFTGIGPVGARFLADALIANRSLTFLNLGMNPIHSAGVRVIAGALKRNSTLLGLDLGGTRCSSSGMIALALGVTLNRTLLSLKCHHNNIGTAGAAAMADAAEANATITTLYAGIGRGLRQHRLVRAAEQRNRRLRVASCRQRDLLLDRVSVPWLPNDLLGIVADYAARPRVAKLEEWLE